MANPDVPVSQTPLSGQSHPSSAITGLEDSEVEVSNNESPSTDSPIFPTPEMDYETSSESQELEEPVTLVCDGQEFKVPKALIHKSPVLTAAFERGFKEQSTGTLEITEFGVDTICWFVDFLFNGDYSIKTDENLAAGTNYNQREPYQTNLDILSHISVNQIADYYDVEELQMLSRDRAELLLKQGVLDGFSEVLDLALCDKITDLELNRLIASFALDNREELFHGDPGTITVNNQRPYGFAGVLLAELVAEDETMDERARMKLFKADGKIGQLELEKDELESRIRDLQQELETTRAEL